MEIPVLDRNFDAQKVPQISRIFNQKMSIQKLFES
jgi:hypothetical protein